MEPIVRPYPGGGSPGAIGSMLPGFIPQLPGETPEAYAMRVAAQKRNQALPVMSPGPNPSLGMDITQSQAPGAPMGPTPSLGQDPMAGPPMPGSPTGPNPSLGQAIDDPLAPAKIGPPQTSEEAQGRRQSWVSLFDQIKNDPQAMMMLLKFGTEMMQPVQPGQTALGQTGRAMQGSVDYLGQLQKSQADSAKSQADLAATGANTQQTQAETGAIPGQIEQRAAETARTKALTPTEEMLKQDTEKGRQELTKIGLEIEDLKMKAKEYPADADLKRRIGEAEIRYKDALAKWTRTTRGSGSAKGPAAAVQNREDIRKSIMKINPKREGESQESYDKRIEPKVLESTTKAKSERAKAREIYINNGSIFRNQPEAEAAAEFDLTWPPLEDDVAKPAAAKNDPLGLKKK